MGAGIESLEKISHGAQQSRLRSSIYWFTGRRSSKSRDSYRLKEAKDCAARKSKGPRRTAHDCHQIQKTPLHRNVGYMRTPHLVGPLDRQIPQEVQIGRENEIHAMIGTGVTATLSGERDFQEGQAAVSRFGRWIGGVPTPGLALVTVVAAVVVIKFAVWLLDPHPYYMLADSAIFVDGAFHPRPHLQRPSGYSLFLAIVWHLVPKLQAGVLAQSLLGLLTAGAYAALFRTFYPSWQRLWPLVFAVVALWPRHLYYEHTILSECVAIFFMAGTVFFVLAHPQRRGMAFLAGLSLGAAILTRSAAVFMIPGVLLAQLLWRRRLRRGEWVRRAAVLLAGVAVLVVPYMSVSRVVLGQFTIAAHDGWALYATVARWIDVEKIQDPRIREIFREREAQLREAEPNHLRWPPNSPAKVLKEFNVVAAKRKNLRKMLATEGFCSTVRCALSSPTHPVVTTNQQLRAIAVRTIRDNPGRYALSVLGHWADYWFGRVEDRDHCQAMDATDAENMTPRWRRFKDMLHLYFGPGSFPSQASNRLLKARYLTFHFRCLLLLLPIYAVIRRRSLILRDQLFMTLVLLMVSLSLGTALITEFHDRYSVPTDAWAILLNFSSLAALFGGSRCCSYIPRADRRT